MLSDLAFNYFTHFHYARNTDSEEFIWLRYVLFIMAATSHIPVFLPGESQGRRSLVGCRLWGRTESDTTEMT